MILKIYQILNSVTDDVYIGSTTQSLCNRMKEHRSKSKKQIVLSRIYKAIQEHGIENFYIELIEKFPCTTKEELCAREGYHIRKEKSSLNYAIAGRSKKEYWEEYYELHREEKKNTIKNYMRHVRKK